MKQWAKGVFPRRLVSLSMVLLLAAGMPLSVFAAEYDLAQGSVTVSTTESGQTVTHGSNDPVGDNAPVIIQSNSETDGTKTAQCDHCTATDTIPHLGSKLTKPEEKTASEGAQPAALYRVTGKDGRAMAFKTIPGRRRADHHCRSGLRHPLRHSQRHQNPDRAGH